MPVCIAALWLWHMHYLGSFNCRMCFDGRKVPFFISSISQFQAVARSEQISREPVQSLPGPHPMARHLRHIERAELESRLSESLASSCPAAFALTGVLQRLQHVEEKYKQVMARSSFLSPFPPSLPSLFPSFSFSRTADHLQDNSEQWKCGQYYFGSYHINLSSILTTFICRVIFAGYWGLAESLLTVFTTNMPFSF